MTTELVPSKLPNGETIYIEASHDLHTLGVEKRPSIEAIPFDEIASAVQGVASTLRGSLKLISPTKTTVTLGFRVDIESGLVTKLVLKGGGGADFTVTLEWA